MSTDNRIRRRSGFRTFMFFIGALMILFYFILGGWLLLDPGFLPTFGGEFRTVFAVLSVVYGFYRGWRWYSDYVR